MKKIFEYDPESGIASCYIQDGNDTVLGIAHCHPDDEEFKSEFTGSFIAESRALLELKRKHRNTIKTELQVLNHLQNCIEHSTRHDPKSYEGNMLLRQIRHKEKKLALINEEIAAEQQYLRDYIRNKDLVHKRIKKAKFN